MWASDTASADQSALPEEKHFWPPAWPPAGEDEMVAADSSSSLGRSQAAAAEGNGVSQAQISVITAAVVVR